MAAGAADSSREETYWPRARRATAPAKHTRSNPTLEYIGTAVVLWPIVRRQSETLALSYVASRVVESVVIVVGLVSLLSVVTLREDFAGSGADAGTLTVAGKSLVAIHDWTFLLGPGFCVDVNGLLLLGYLFYRSGLVPRSSRSPRSSSRRPSRHPDVGALASRSIS
jgi:hypothetical protein